MTFKELASRLTGFSFPMFGVSFNPVKADREIAKNIITFLEDRRVLYNAYELEVPSHCYQSVVEIRHFLTEQLNSNPGDELAGILRGMRAACRRVMDTGARSHGFINGHGRLGIGEEIEFFSAVGVFRATMGLFIAQLIIRYGLSIEADLASILPFDIED